MPHTCAVADEMTEMGAPRLSATFSTTIQPAYDQHTTTIQSTEDCPQLRPIVRCWSVSSAAACPANPAACSFSQARPRRVAV